MHPFDTDEIDTPAGTYTVAFHTDEYPDQPHDHGFALVAAEIDTDDERRLPALVAGALAAHSRRDDDRELRSGTAILRYLRLSGIAGAVLVTESFSVDTPTADRFDTVHGVAFAPDDATSPDRYTRNALESWRAWSNGDVFGYTVTSPSGDEIDACWGYYGFDREREYVMSTARDMIDGDVAERVAHVNTVGAGYVGVV